MDGFGDSCSFDCLAARCKQPIPHPFQKPYSFEAHSEPTIEIVDTPIILDITAKPAVRNQVGSVTTPGETSSAGIQVSNVTSTSTVSENFTQLSTAQWQQGNGPPAGPVRNIFAASDGTVYAVIQTGIYRLTADATAWTHVDASVQIDESLMPMAEHSGTLYIVADEIFASDNRGEMWRSLGPRPKGDAVELVTTDAERVSSQQAPITMYLALRDRGIFRSTDDGALWVPLNDGLTVSEKFPRWLLLEKQFLRVQRTVSTVSIQMFGKNCRWIHREPSVPWQYLGMIFMLG